MMRVAIVHDDFIQHGGAEKLVLAMLEIYPEADLYAVSASDQWRREIKDLFNKDIRTTWIKNLPLRHRYFRFYYTFYPLAVESFNFDGYDLVVSSSARYAHGIITKPSTVHVSYVNSPARFLWEDNLIPQDLLAQPIIRWQKAWDTVASQRPDYLIANSKAPARKIEKYWGRKVDAVIYPFVDLEKFMAVDSIGMSHELVEGSIPLGNKGYFLIVSRLNEWKRLDIAVETFTKINLPLYIIGDGSERENLEKMAGPSVKFLGCVSDGGKINYLRHCRALIVPQAEDFGIVILEANACGRPVIAYKGGGSLELISEEVNGLFFSEQQVASLMHALKRFDQIQFNRENCLKAAKRFTKNRFKKALGGFVQSKMSFRQNY